MSSCIKVSSKVKTRSLVLDAKMIYSLDWLASYCESQEIDYTSLAFAEDCLISQDFNINYIYIHYRLLGRLGEGKTESEASVRKKANFLRLLIGVLPKRSKFYDINGSDFLVLIQQLRDIGPVNTSRLLGDLVDSSLECIKINSNRDLTSSGDDLGSGGSDILLKLDVLGLYDADLARFPSNPILLMDALLSSDQEFKKDFGHRYLVSSFSAQGIHSLIEPNVEADFEKIFIDQLSRSLVEPHYQPIVNLQTNQIVGFEVLARIKANGVLHSPNRFLPVFQKYALVETFDLTVLERGVSDLLVMKNSINLKHFVFSINISGATFNSPVAREKIIDSVSRVASTCPDISFQFEILEQEVTISNADMDEFIARLKGLGAVVAIDDFGIGYSSLKRLLETDINTVKLDRFFVAFAGELDAQKELILKGIVASLVQSGMKVVAEGIETSAQLSFAKDMGVLLAQGFCFYRPLSFEAVLGLFSTQKSLADPINQKGQETSFWSLHPGRIVHRMIRKLTR